MRQEYGVILHVQDEIWQDGPLDDQPNEGDCYG